MPRVSSAFFLVAALCGLAGMAWGSQMGMSGDHSLSPAHAHLNLLGWVSLSIMGGFYALSPRSGWLPWANLILSSAGAILMGVLLPQVLTGKLSGQVMMAAELPAVLGMLLFIAAIVSGLRRPAAA
ncbi:MAG: hypothetical protein Q7J28_04185 [Caulobacter sp.]|nr:hypothetical protein [Caulobacter sp.]